MLVDPCSEAAAKVGVRLIAPDRPGYGHSTFQVSRRLTNWSSDVEALADELGLESFAVLGYSGGGPHALACAALLPSRVTRASVVSGIGPMGTSADTEGMMRSNKVISALVRRSEWAVMPLTIGMTTYGRRRPEQAIRSMCKELPPVDVATIERPEIFAGLVEEARLASATSARATAQDMALFSRPWGFELAEVNVPVDFWQGDADRNVPPAHARRQSSAVRGSDLHEVSDEGHFMLFNRPEVIFQALLR
jgi:pimeloyl-ACP methyl ester carboxylesterase